MRGKKLEHTFLIKILRSKLAISSAKTSCGCTVPKFPKEPILPNQQSEIIVVFNTKGKFGKQNKTVTLLNNTVPRAKVLTIKGYINKTINKNNMILLQPKEIQYQPLIMFGLFL